MEEIIKKKETCENHDKCMEMIQAILDGSASEDEIERFKENMEICNPCIEGHNLEQSIKDALRNKIDKKCCPETTKSWIISKIGIVGIIIILIKII